MEKSGEIFHIRRRMYCVKLVKSLLFGLVVLTWLFGASLLILGVWMRAAYQGHIRTVDLLTGWDVNPSFIFIAVGGCMFLIAFHGCVGALRDNICLLKFFAISLVVMISVQLFAGKLFKKKEIEK